MKIPGWLTRASNHYGSLRYDTADSVSFMTAVLRGYVIIEALMGHMQAINGSD